MPKSQLTQTIFYGAERGKKRKEIERVQARYIKSALGIAINTPDYIWKLETRTNSIKVKAIKRLFQYILRVIKMDEERYLKKAMTEALIKVEKEESKWIKKT